MSLNSHRGMLVRACLGSLEVSVERRAVSPLGPLPSPHLDADDHEAQGEGGAKGGTALGSLRHHEEVDGSRPELPLSETLPWTESEPLCICSCSCYECESVCPVHSEAKQDVRVWSRDKCTEGPARRQLAHALKTANSWKAVSKTLFSERCRKGVGSCCKRLAVRSFALEVRCSCKPPPKQMLFSVLTSKGKVLRLNFHPPRSRAWVRGGDPSEDQLPPPPYLRPAPSIGPPTSTQALLKRQISAGSSLRAWYSDPAWLSSQGSQEPRTQLALRVLRPLK